MGQAHFGVSVNSIASVSIRNMHGRMGHLAVDLMNIIVSEVKFFPEARTFSLPRLKVWAMPQRVWHSPCIPLQFLQDAPGQNARVT